LRLTLLVIAVYALLLSLPLGVTLSHVLLAAA
jgi:hypothetical protein